MDFTNSFNTKLSTDQEKAFQDWAFRQSNSLGRNVLNDTQNYDLRGFWNKNSGPDLTTMHLPDTFKKPNHPTFSDESIYHNTPDGVGGKYVGGRWTGDDKTGWAFQPSKEMLKSTHNMGDLQQYFADFEPDAAVVPPTVNTR